MHYATVTQAIDRLQEQGFTTDFNLGENCTYLSDVNSAADEFKIVDVYRYEGNTDPADEATVYAIESSAGVKGILVTGFGISADSRSAAWVRKLGMST